MVAAMTCQELVELVTAYLEGALSPAERTRFEQHLALCLGCRNYLEQMRLTLAVLGKIDPDDFDPQGRQDLLEHFRDWKSRS